MVADEAEREDHEQFEIGFMDLSQFDELERKVVGVIKRLGELRSQNTELRDRIGALESEMRSKSEENERLIAEREELLHNQKNEQKEDLIRQKVQELLKKLDEC